MCEVVGCVRVRGVWGEQVRDEYVLRGYAVSERTLTGWMRENRCCEGKK